MSTVGSTALAAGDIVTITCYFLFVIFVGLWTSRANRGSVGGYFLAGRSMHWIPLGASLFASNVGSLHFVGLAGSGAASGIAIAIYEFNAIFVLVMLGWLFVPVYIASGVYTMPEYIRKRFGGQRIRMYLAVLSLLVYVFTKISADLYAGALFIEQAFNWNVYGAICFLLAIAALFTIGGGLTAVIWTDTIQTIIMIIGAITLMIIGFVDVGGMQGLRYKYERAVPNTTFLTNDTCGYPRDDYFHMFRDPQTGDIPWPGIFGMTINSIWYWCADQVIVQRALAGKNYSHSKGGTVLAGYIKILPMFILVFPGMIARVLFPDEVACVEPEVCKAVCGSESGCSNIAYPLLVINLLPTGARGLLLAVMLSALMSSLTSIFNSSSTIFTIDIWRKLRKQASDSELMIVGRICVLVLVVVSILWIPVIQASQGGQLFVYIQQVSSFLQPPICAIYILAIFWSRLTEPAAFWSLMVGLLIGMTRFILEFSFPEPPCYGSGGVDDRPAIIKDFHYLYFAAFLFVVVVLTAVVISLLTPPIDPKHLHRLTYQTRYSTEHREDIDNSSLYEVDAAIDEKKGADVPEENVYENAPWYKKAVYWICGIEKQMGEGGDPLPTLSEEEQRAHDVALTNIHEQPKWKLITNINAIIVLTVAIFFVGFFY